MRIHWRGYCRAYYGFERWLLALVVSLITVIALLNASNLSPSHEEPLHNLAQEMGLVERIHVMIVMCHKHNDGSTKEEVTINFSLGLIKSGVWGAQNISNQKPDRNHRYKTKL